MPCQRWPGCRGSRPACARVVQVRLRPHRLVNVGLGAAAVLLRRCRSRVSTPGRFAWRRGVGALCTPRRRASAFEWAPRGGRTCRVRAAPSNGRGHGPPGEWEARHRNRVKARHVRPTPAALSSWVACLRLVPSSAAKEVAARWARGPRARRFGHDLVRARARSRASSWRLSSHACAHAARALLLHALESPEDHHPHWEAGYSPFGRVPATAQPWRQPVDRSCRSRLRHHRGRSSHVCLYDCC